MNMENAMIKAIRKFKKEHKTCEIRTCVALEMSGVGNKIDYALFGIEFVEESGGEYHNVEISVYKGVM